MNLKAFQKSRPAEAFGGFSTNPLSLIIRLILLLFRLISGGIPGIPVI